MSDKHPSNAGEGRAAIGGRDISGPGPATPLTKDEFIRTCFPEEMSRKQRRLCKKKLGEPGAGGKPKKVRRY